MNNARKRLGIAFLTAGLIAAAPLTVNYVSAQTTGSTSAAAQAVDYAQVFINKLAAALGIDATKLQAAIKQANSDTIDQALKNQDITRAQADQMKQQAQNGQFGFFGGRGFGHMRGMGGGLGMINQGTLLDAAAKALGMTSADLQTQLRSGKTLADVAKAKGVAATKVQDAIKAALKTQLDAEVKAGRLTQAQADAMLQRVQDDTLDYGLGGRGMMFGPRGGFGRDGFGPGRGFGGRGGWDNPQTVPNGPSNGSSGGTI